MVVGRDQKARGLRGGLILTTPLWALFPAARAARRSVASVGATVLVCFGLCTSARICCVYVWFAREPAKSKTKEASASQRETQAGRTERQPTSAQLATVRHTARDGHVHTGDPSASDANMSPAPY